MTKSPSIFELEVKKEFQIFFLFCGFVRVNGKGTKNEKHANVLFMLNMYIHV